MPTETKELLAFNRGVISPRGLARIDLERMAMSADRQRNWMPRVLGSMMLRPGFGFIDRPDQDVNFKSRQLPFTFGADDQALLEMSIVSMRVRIDDVLLTRPAVATTIIDGGFNGSLGVGWIDNSDSGGTATISSGSLKLRGDGTDFGIVRQTVTVAAPAQGVEHSLSITTLYNGSVRLKVGSVAGEDDYIEEMRLGQGIHSLAFTPTGNFIIELAHEREFDGWVLGCSIEQNQIVEIPTPYAEEDMPFLRWDQSGDVIYIACKNATTTGIQYNAEKLIKIERRGTGRSWSVVQYAPEDGPFRVQNVSGVTIETDALSGDVTLTASQPIFTSNHAFFGSLFRIASSGQTVTKTTSSDVGDFTTPIRVVGSETAREFGIIIEGSFTATATLQFAFSADGPWNDQGGTYTIPTSTTLKDGQDGQIIYYRLICKSGDWTSGTSMTMTLTYTGGSIQGVARVRLFTDSTHVFAQVLSPFGAAAQPSKDWWEGEWSAQRGYPTSVGLHEGRLWWAGNDKIFGSISDSYESFDDNFEGDGGPISRSIGFGPIKVINWLLSMGRLLFGTSNNSANVAAVKMDGNDPLGARSNSFDEPLTPTNFNVKSVSSRSVFVDRTEQRLYELTYNLDEQDYKSLDLSIFAPDFNIVGIVQIAVQMKPDIRIHCVRSDGTVGVLIFDRLENVICWIDIDSAAAGGEIEDVAVLTGRVEDQVYYTIKRTINGATQRHICKWALESEAIGSQLNKMADSFVTYEGAATVNPFTTELLHLRDEEVVIWADGIDVGTDTVTAAGALTNPLATAAANVVAGLGYIAQFKSAKMAELTGIGLLERKKVNQIGFIAENMHYQGLQYGPDFDNLSDLPQVSRGQTQPVNQIYATYHEDNFSFGGTWDEDSRICLQAAAPKPCTILAAIADIQSVEYGNERNRPR
jgi:hypothetical protein